MGAEPEPQIPVEFTPEFKRNLRALAKKYPHIRSDIEPLIVALQSGGRPGDRIQGTSYVVLKTRAPNSDSRRGQRGGYRVIYQVAATRRVVLITVYSKSDQADVTPADIRRIIRQWELETSQ